MEQFGFLVNMKNCVACKACEVACKNRNGLDSPGPRLRIVATNETGTFPDARIAHMSMACMHCAEPACMNVCPAGAISKSDEDGTVAVDHAKCIGCHYCFFACPFGVPSYRSDDGTMIKCDGCRDRRAMGLEPACSHTCFYNALYAGPLSELREQATQMAAKGIGGKTDASVLVVE